MATDRFGGTVLDTPASATPQQRDRFGGLVQEQQVHRGMQALHEGLELEAQLEIQKRESGIELVPHPRPDGTTDWIPTQVRKPTRLSAAERQAIRDAVYMNAGLQQGRSLLPHERAMVRSPNDMSDEDIAATVNPALLDPVYSAVRAPVTSVARMGSVIAEAGGRLARAGAEAAGFEGAANFLTNQIERQQQYRQDVDAFLPPSVSAQQNPWGASGIIEGVGGQADVVSAFALNPSVGLLYAGLRTGTESAGAIERELELTRPDMTPEDRHNAALLLGTLSGVVEGTIEQFSPLNRFARGKGQGSVLRKVIMGALTEAPVEFTQSLATSGIQALAQQDPSFVQALKDAAYEAYIGAAAGGVFGVGAHVSEQAAARKRAQINNYIDQLLLPAPPNRPLLPAPTGPQPYDLAPPRQPVQPAGELPAPEGSVPVEARGGATIPFREEVTPAHPPLPLEPEQRQGPEVEALNPENDLPPALKSASPKHRIQEGGVSRGVPIEFSTGVDKALYIASQPRKGKLQAEANRYLEEQGFTPERIKQEAARVREAVETAALYPDGDVLQIGPVVQDRTIPLATEQWRPQERIPVESAPVQEIPLREEVQTESRGIEGVPQTQTATRQARGRDQAPQASPQADVRGSGQAVSPEVQQDVRETGPILKEGQDQGLLFKPVEPEVLQKASRSIPDFKVEKPQNREQTKVRNAFRRRGVEVVYFSGKTNAGGFYVRSQGGERVLFIRRDRAGRDLQNAVAHEFMHELRKSRPGLFKQFMDAIPADLREQAKQRYQDAARRSGLDAGLTPALLEEEAVTTMFGDIAENPRVWSAALGENPGLLQRILDFFRRFAAKLSGKSRMVDEAIKVMESTLAEPIGELPSIPQVSTQEGPREQAFRTTPQRRYVVEEVKDLSFQPVPSERIRDEARRYAEQAGIDYDPDTTYAEVNTDRAARIAKWYEQAKHEPNNPEVRRSYEAFKRETAAQWEFLQDEGVVFEPWTQEGQPYANSEEMKRDAIENKHLYFFTGGDMPADHPLAEKMPGTEYTYNDVFRAVHDYFGHAKEGVGFGPRGEENAWRQHSQMYSEEARGAMGAETRGQNSWVNYGPYGEQNRRDPANTIYAEQKATLLPSHWRHVSRPQEIREAGRALERTLRRQTGMEDLESVRTQAQELSRRQDRQLERFSGESPRVEEEPSDDIVFAPDQPRRRADRDFSELSTVGLRERPLTALPDPGPYGDVTNVPKTKVIEVAKALNKWTRDIAGVARTRAEQIKRFVDASLQEIKYQLTRPESGAGWYSRDVREMRKAMIERHPELKNPDTYSFFATIVGIMSQGNKPDPNLRYADAVYRLWKRDGTLPRRQPNGKNWPGNVKYEIAFARVEQILEDMGGFAGFRKFIRTRHPVSELRAYNRNISGKASDKKHGAFVFGPKIGPFILGIQGVKTVAVKDLWFSRTWNRYMGTLVENNEVVDAPRSDAEREVMEEAIQRVAAITGIDPMDVQAILWFYEKELYGSHGAPLDLGSYSKSAKRVAENEYDIEATGASAQEDNSLGEAESVQGEAGREARRRTPGSSEAGVGEDSDIVFTPDTSGPAGKEFLPEAKPKAKKAADALRLLRKYITKSEAEKMTPRQQERALEMLEKLPPVEEYVEAAKLGMAYKGWYEESARAFVKMFGKDARRFVAVLSATSPRQTVRRNLIEALRAWRVWTEAGRPTDPDEIERLMTTPMEESGMPPVRLRTRVPNVVRALTDTDLSGFKVASFAANLADDADAVTNDTWMASFAGIDQKEFTNFGSYVGYSVRVRQAAEKLGIEPREAQETIWSFFRSLTESITSGISGVEALRKLTHEQVMGASSFADLMEDSDVQQELRSLGLSSPDRGDRSRGAGFSGPVLAGREITPTLRRIAERAERASRYTRQAGDDPEVAFTPAALRTRGNLPEDAYALNQERIGRIASEEKRTEFATAQLSRAVKQDYGVSPRSLPPSEVERLDRALKGQIPLSEFKPATAAAIQTMRDHVDSLTRRLMQTSLVDPRLRVVLGDNLGTYLNRSYRIFDDSGWAKRIPEPVMANAVRYVEGQLISQGKDPALAPVFIEELIQDWKQGGVDALFRKGKLGAKNLSILKKRRDIAPEIRALMGEYRNPFVNYVKSVSKMATLLSNHEFLESVKAEGLGSWLFEDDTAKPGYTTRIAAPESSAMAPLNGLRTSPEIAEAFEKMFSSNQLPGWARVLLTANYVAKASKTVYSLMTQMRNLIGQPYFNLLNGHFRISKYGKTFAALRADILNKGPQQLQDYVTKLYRLGVLGQSVKANELIRDLRDMGVSDTDLYAADGFLPVLKSRAKQVALKAPQKAYQVSDHLGKVYGFENELARSREVNPDFTEEQHEKWAAERVLNTYPTYSKVPPAIQKLRRQPFVGPFVAFWYESFRTMGNSVIYAYQDLMKGKNAAQRRAGAERLAGLTAVAGGSLAAMEITKALLGISDDEEEGFRRFLPEWSKGNTFLFTGKSGDGSLEYIDLSALNPYSSVVDTLGRIFRGEGDAKERLAEAVVEFLGPLVSEQIFTKALAEVYSNKTEAGGRIYNPEDSQVNQWTAILGHLLEAVEPGTSTRFRERILPGLRGQETSYGDKIEPGREIVAEVSGIKTRSFNYHSALSFQGRRFQESSRDVSGLFLRELSRPGTKDPVDILEVYRDMETRREKQWRDLYAKIEAARLGGLADIDIYRALIEGGVGREQAKALIAGRYMPYDIRGDAVREAWRKHGEAIPIRQMAELYRDRVAMPLGEE